MGGAIEQLIMSLSMPMLILRYITNQHNRQLPRHHSLDVWNIIGCCFTNQVKEEVDA